MNDWDDLHCFTVLVEKQTLTAAAETLGVQHSTISRRIARLEATLGLRLFDRIGRRYLLTDEGARIRAQAQEIAVGMDSLLRTAREQREEMAEVVVSAPPLVAKGLLIPHFAAFARRHANIRLVLQSDAHISNLHARHADIALRIVRPTQNDLVARRLRPIRYRFYAREGYLRSRPRAEQAFLCLNIG
ncbi:MAG: LysR family transcriptional regulator, partial [Kingella oralis]